VLKLAKRNYHSLGTFIRLVDYMVVETQVKINQESADLILAEMGKERGKYGIQTTVDFDPEGQGMAFEPAETEFAAQFEKLLQDMQSVTEEVVRVISHQDFRQFIHGLISDSGPRFRAIVEGSFAYATSKATIQNRIVQDFAHLKRKVDKCEQCADINAFDQTFVFEDFQAEHSDLESIKMHLDRLQKWEGKIANNIKPLETKGLIWAQGRKLRERLSQRVKTEQGHMKEYLRELAERKARESSTGLIEIRNRLKEPADTLAAYVGYCTELELCRQKKEHIAEQKKRLDEMKGVLSKYKGKDEGGYGGFGGGSGALQGKIEQLATDISDVEALLQQAGETVKEALEGNVEELEKRVQEEQEKVSALIEKISKSETLMQASTPAKEALEEAARYKKRFDNSVERLAQYQAYQATLKLPAPAVPEVEEFEKQFAVRHRLWQIRQTFGEQQRRWYGENFRDQDAAAIVATVAERATELVKMKMAIGRETQDEVHAAATMEVQDVKRHSALIAALGNPSMQEKHWVKIWALCETPPATLLNFSFQTLLSQGIDAHLERVEEVSAFAAGEAAILKTVSEIAAAWEETAFTVRGYRDTKDRFYITEVEELTIQLEDHQMTVQTSMGSKYVAEIREEVEAWEKRLGYISDCLDEWLIFQKAWMYLENIFNAEDIVAQLPMEAKLFV